MGDAGTGADELEDNVGSQEVSMEGASSESDEEGVAGSLLSTDVVDTWRDMRLAWGTGSSVSGSMEFSTDVSNMRRGIYRRWVR